MAIALPSATDLGLAPAPSIMSSSATATPYETTPTFTHSSTHTHAQQQKTPPSQCHTPSNQPPPPPPLPQPQQQAQPQPQTTTTTTLPPLQLHQQMQSASSSRSVKRPRPVKSCTECRKRKLRCDRLCPCSQCQKSGRACKYAADNDSANLSDASDVEGGLPSSAEVLASRPAKRSCPPSGIAVTGGDGLFAPASARNGDGQAVPMLEDLSARMDRLEKHLLARSPGDMSDPGFGGGWRRSIEVSPVTVRGLSVKNGGTRTRFLGPASPRVLLNLFNEAKDFLHDHTHDPEARDVMISFRKLHKLLRTEYQKSLKPITVYVDSMMPIQKRMVDILPKRHVCDRLVAGYFDNHETFLRIIHVPTFMDEYYRYWEGTLQSEAFLPKLLGVLSIASRFETKSKGLGHERSEGIHLPTAAALVRLWLNTLRGKQTVELETLQIELLWVLTIRFMREYAQDGWTQLGCAMRMAMSMGLHRDSSEFGSSRITPFNAEMRRRLWASIADLDYYMSNDCNLPSLLRESDATCGPPRNIDDADLHPDMTDLPPAQPFDQPTDTHVQAYAATTFGLRKKAAALVDRIDSVRDWTEIMDVAAKLERHLEEIDLMFPRAPPSGDARKARLWRCRGLLETHVRMSLLGLYRPFVLGVSNVPTYFLRSFLRHSFAVVKPIEELDPSMPHYEKVVDICHASFKDEAVQAALGLCYYIRAAMRPGLDATTMNVHQALRTSPEPDSLHNRGSSPDGGMLFSPARMIHTVEKVLEFLVRNIKRGDVKDIVCLSVVLESVRRPEPRTDDIVRGLSLVLEQCMRVANCSLEVLAAAAQPAESQAESYGYAIPNSYSHSPTFLGSLSDPDEWLFWDGWD